ncbi:ATP-dependent helicase [Kitasatospora sp. NBC_00240]|uniref:ATP-dependent helicase n=1 Tax=Kitasatospora sp. NBC_00240 TaxID=2903567 RepID=UPI0022525300|nr:ATP-dependent DNA helicase [Kitasatospora sp. NBC_00240]MCX5210926.1 ATP-dependent helicase [Kitasatospora sp. NBC_00240]
MTSPYRLVRSPLAQPAPPVLDPYQQAVVEHAGGPLLVLAGPGTGKTTTLVEAVARRIEQGTDPDRILVLTFSRKAAMELRDRMSARIGAAAAAPQATVPAARQAPEAAGPQAAQEPVLRSPQDPVLRSPQASALRSPQATTFHSFCYALLRSHQDPEAYAEPLRLLSGPEQDVMVRELLAGGAEDARLGAGRISWPLDLRACLTTRGFADEVRAVLARSRELGLGEAELKRFADGVQRPDWAAAAHFLADYLDVLDLRGVLDYAELVHRAVLLAERPEVGDELRRRYDVVFVDEYQDTDPSQVRLLRQLAGGGRDLVAVGDPDQSIYAFRGADINGILDFPQAFPKADGDPADVLVLRVSRRSGAVLLAASRELARRMPMGRLPADKLAQHRALLPSREGGRVEVYTYATPGTELDSVADLLRRAHLEDGVPWGEMAVLVRAGGRSIPGVRRALSAAGVPLEIDGDDVPLREEPAVTPLLLALRVCAEQAALDRPGRRFPDAVEAVEEPADGPADGPADAEEDGRGPAADGPLTADLARTLLTGPLGGMDGSDLRRLGRALREEERQVLRQAERAGQDGPDGQGAPVRPAGATVRSAEELIREALAEPERLVAMDPSYARRARDLGMLLRKVRELLAGGGTAKEALWALWDGSRRWRERLERAALRGGAGGRNADRDLDALCALFETAARAEEQVTGHRSALDLLAELEAQDIAADTLTVRAVRPDAVRLMTAHRSKGLEWRVVVVAGVQDGLWPDLRRRGSLLEADRIGRDGLAEPLSPAALLGEERRLFYVAATRAKERLIVTAVKAPAEDGDEPSRFLRELYREELDPRTGRVLRRTPQVVVEDITHRPRRPLSVPALVAELRAVTVDPHRSPELRRAAAERLARLAAAADEDGLPLVPVAHPDRWWGLDDATAAPDPLRRPDVPVRLSGSGLEQLENCSLQWFLDKEVQARTTSSAAQGFGNVVHALTDEVGSGRTPADLAVLMERLDTVWDALAFDAPWKSHQEKHEARAALERFLNWHVLERGRSTVATEHGFDVTLDVGGIAVQIRGSMDRVEKDAAGRAYVVDFKTGKQIPTEKSLPEHKQLAVYQLAVRAGALNELPGFETGVPMPGGAELVHLRAADKALPDGPKVQQQAPPDGEPWIENLLADAAGRVLAERFVPATGTGCDRCSFRRSCSAQRDGAQLIE